MIKAGTICVWQNVPEPFDYMNGVECTALSGLRRGPVNFCDGVRDALFYETDQMMPGRPRPVVALPHELREKNPPPDEVDEVEKTEFKEPACA